MTQRRELLRLLFANIAVKHVGYRNGPRVDPGRLVLTWARWPPPTMAPGDGDFDSAPGYPDRLTCQVASDSVGHLIICGCCGQQDLVDSGQELVKHSVLSQRSSHWNAGGPLHVLRRDLGEGWA